MGILDGIVEWIAEQVMAGSVNVFKFSFESARIIPVFCSIKDCNCSASPYALEVTFSSLRVNNYIGRL